MVFLNRGWTSLDLAILKIFEFGLFATAQRKTKYLLELTALVKQGKSSSLNNNLITNISQFETKHLCSAPSWTSYMCPAHMIALFSKKLPAGTVAKTLANFSHLHMKLVVLAELLIVTSELLLSSSPQQNLLSWL